MIRFDNRPVQTVQELFWERRVGTQRGGMMGWQEMGKTAFFSELIMMVSL